MRYDYKCEETGEVVEKEFSMKDDLPQSIEIDGKTFKRVWQMDGGGIHIPFQWGQETNLRKGFSKSPSQKKHFY
jgi:hypothetical protein